LSTLIRLFPNQEYDKSNHVLVLSICLALLFHIIILMLVSGWKKEVRYVKEIQQTGFNKQFSATLVSSKSTLDTIMPKQESAKTANTTELETKKPSPLTNKATQQVSKVISSTQKNTQPERNNIPNANKINKTQTVTPLDAKKPVSIENKANLHQPSVKQIPEVIAETISPNYFSSEATAHSEVTDPIAPVANKGQLSQSLNLTSPLIRQATQRYISNENVELSSESFLSSQIEPSQIEHSLLKPSLLKPYIKKNKLARGELETTLRSNGSKLVRVNSFGKEYCFNVEPNRSSDPFDDQDKWYYARCP
jgi:hypothetical protein